ncbi:MAG: NF038132 family protein [Pseudomonadota bacterium]|nr:NF038132 family protein [Pseudomonadota bacterium]
MIRNKPFLLSVVLTASLLGTSVASASSCVGNCGNIGPNGSVTAPPAGGPNYGYVSTNGGVSGAGQIASVGGTNGSSYTTDVFTAAANDPLKFYFNYVTSDGTGTYVDYAFSELQTSAGNHVAWLFTARTTPTGNTSPGFGLPANDSALTPMATPITPGAPTWSPLGGSSGTCFSGPSNGCGYTGWIGSNYAIAAAGNYQIKFGVTNFGDKTYDSGLAFAGVTVNGNPVPVGGVPEPATWALLVSGFGMVGFASRRRNTSVTA